MFEFQHFHFLKRLVLPRPIQFHWVEQTTSTNDDLKNFTRTHNIQIPYALLAKRQTAGRGTKGKTWCSQQEALMFSLAYPLKYQHNLSLLPLLTGLSVLQTLAQHQIPLQLKWPNDLFYAQAKLGGILCEITRNVCIIGIGINITLPPISITTQGWPITSLQEAGYPHNYYSPEIAHLWFDLVFDLVTQLDNLPHISISEFITKWNQADLLYQKPLRFSVANTDSNQLGIGQGINTLGRYQILTKQGIQSFHDITIFPH